MKEIISKWTIPVGALTTNSFEDPEESGVTVGNEIQRQMSPNGFALFTPMHVEFRGITLRQLRAIMANIKKRCLEEE